MNPAGDGWWLLGVGGSELWGTRHRWQSEQLRGQASSADTLLTVAPLPARSPPSSPRDRPPPHLPYPLPTPLSPSVPIRLPSALSEGAVGGGRRGGGLPPAASPAGRRHRARCRRRRRLAHAPARLCCPRPSCGSPSFPLPLPPPPPPLPPPPSNPVRPASLPAGGLLGSSRWAGGTHTPPGGQGACHVNPPRCRCVPTPPPPTRGRSLLAATPPPHGCTARGTPCAADGGNGPRRSCRCRRRRWCR